MLWPISLNMSRMRAALIVLILGLRGFPCARKKGTQETETSSPSAEDDLYETREKNVPFVMIDHPEDGYILPRMIDFDENQQIRFGAFSSFDFHYLCPLEDQKIIEQIKKTRSSSNLKNFFIVNCLFDAKLGTMDDTCNSEILPYLGEHKKCGKNRKGTSYTFEYMICKNINPNAEDYNRKKLASEGVLDTRRVIVYEFCFDHSKKRVLYIWYKIQSPQLLLHVESVKKLTDYESNIISTSNFGHKKFKNVFQSFANKFIEMPFLVRHKIVPPSHMTFSVLKKATYHYANVAAMSPEVNSLWDFIDERIRQKAINFKSPLEVYMGEFIFNDNKTYWCKLVSELTMDGGSIAIVVSQSWSSLWDEKGLFEKNKTENCNFNEWEGHEEVETNLAYCFAVKEKYLKLFGREFPKEIKQNGSEKYLSLDVISP